MIEQWTALEAVLPRTDNFVLGDPATPAQLAALEEKIGFAVPEIAQLLAVRNGADGFDWEWYLFSCDELLSDRNVMLGLMSDFAEEKPDHQAGIKQVFWNPKWVQFATDGGGNLYCVDYDPAPGGSLGQIIFWDHEDTATIVAPSLEQWLVKERESILKAGESGSQ